MHRFHSLFIGTKIFNMTIIQLPLLAMSYNEALCSLNLPSYKIICPISTIYVFCIKLHLSFSGPTFFMVSGNTDTWLCYLSVCYSQSTKSCCSLVSYLINFNQRQCRKYMPFVSPSKAHFNWQAFLHSRYPEWGESCLTCEHLFELHIIFLWRFSIACLKYKPTCKKAVTFGKM